MKIGMIVRNIISRLLFVCLIIVYALPILIFICLPRSVRYSNKTVFILVYFFYWVILKFSLLPIHYVGLENLPDRPAIFAANHQSSFDIPLLGVLAGKKSHIWLATSDLLKSKLLRYLVPILSVMVDVSSPVRAMRSLRNVIMLANQHDNHIMIFPEGGRYTDGMVHKFFGGFVMLAKKMGRPVVPVCILGIDKVYPPNSLLVHWYPVTVVIGKPFVYEEGDTDENFKERVYQWFVEQTGQKR